jgi:hypothetical protein
VTYMILIYDEWQAKSEAVHAAEHGEYMALRETPQWRAGAALQPSTTSKTVRVRDGKTLTTDGPYAETREQLGGYYLVEAKDVEEAIAFAEKIPGARTGCVEVRPVIQYG